LSNIGTNAQPDQNSITGIGGRSWHTIHKP